MEQPEAGSKSSPSIPSTAALCANLQDECGVCPAVCHRTSSAATHALTGQAGRSASWAGKASTGRPRCDTKLLVEASKITVGRQQVHDYDYESLQRRCRSRLTLRDFDLVPCRQKLCLLLRSSLRFAAQGAARNRQDLAGELTKSLGSELQRNKIILQATPTQTAPSCTPSPKILVESEQPARDPSHSPV